MEKAIKKYELDKPLKQLYPQEWLEYLSGTIDMLEFRNLQHFKNVVSKITQKEENKCGISYEQALKELVSNTPTITRKEYETIKNTVKNNLLKRGLISENIYESYKYDVDGQIVDVAKVIEGDPACMLTPAQSYTSYFYELYLSISYPYSVENSHVMEQLCKILATIELLEEEHIYIKVTLVFPDKQPDVHEDRSLLMILPLFSHKDVKSIEVMSSVLNDRLLRKFGFALLEDIYGSQLSSGYGTPVDLPNAITPVNVSEEELCSTILDKVIEKGTR